MQNIVAIEVEQRTRQWKLQQPELERKLKDANERNDALSQQMARLQAEKDSVKL